MGHRKYNTGERIVATATDIVPSSGPAHSNFKKRVTYMKQLPNQSFDNDLEVMELAAALSESSANKNADATQIDVPLRHRRILTSSLVDSSVFSWVANGSPKTGDAERIERDLKAFEDLTLLAAIGLIKLHIPASVADELAKGRFSCEAKSKILTAIRLGRMKIKAESMRLAAGQKPYGIQHASLSALSLSYDDQLRQLLEASPDPTVPKEDQEHYLMACLSGFSFISMDYRLCGRIAGAITKQIAVVKGENKQKPLPKTRPPLRVPVVTPSLLLRQVMYNQQGWETRLELARTEPDCRKCHDLRRQLAHVGQELATLVIDCDADPHQVSVLEVRFCELEQQLQNGKCNADFFNDVDEEWQPAYWRSLKNSHSS